MSLVRYVSTEAAADVRNEGEPSGIHVSVVPVHTAVAGRARLNIGGMRGSPAIASLLERGLTGFTGVHNVSASALTGNILIHYESTTSLDQLIDRISGLLRGEIVPLLNDPFDCHWHTMEAEAVACELGSSCSGGLSSARAAQSPSIAVSGT